MKTIASLAGCAVALVLSVGCGDDSSDGSGTTSGSGGGGGTTTGGSSAGGSSSGGEGGGGDTLNGCTPETAEDMTGMATVTLTWTLSHQECITVDVGTTVEWEGSFSAHPLAGGETGSTDASSPITGSDQSGDTASVTFDAAGEYPYWCTIHSSAMQGVIYVE